jgi:superfamily II DNA or RNA helicase
MAQSLARRDDLVSRTAGYGLVIVDECHHVPAVTFEACVKQIPARRWIGLTATPYRRDGLQAIIAMHCGPTRHQIALTATPGAAPPRKLIIHQTDHAPADADESSIQQVFRALVENHRRTAAICADILDALDRAGTAWCSANGPSTSSISVSSSAAMAAIPSCSRAAWARRLAAPCSPP